MSRNLDACRTLYEHLQSVCEDDAELSGVLILMMGQLVVEGEVDLSVYHSQSAARRMAELIKSLNLDVWDRVTPPPFDSEWGA